MCPQDLTECERVLWNEFLAGRPVDLSTGHSDPDHPCADAEWDSAGTIRAEVIRALLLHDQERHRGRAPAFRLKGACISGQLDLAHVELSCPVFLERCFKEIPDLRWTVARYLDLSHSRLPGILADNLHVGGDLVVSSSRIDGAVTLCGAHIVGNLNFRNSHLDNPSGTALDATGASVTDALMRDLIVNGEMRLGDMQLSGRLELSGARLSNPGGVALEGSRLTVGGPVLCRYGFTSIGEMRLRRARITGFLDFSQAQLSNPGRPALFAPGVSIEGGISFREGSLVDGEVNLLGGRINGDLNLSGVRLRNPSRVAFEGRRLIVDGAVFCRDGFSCEGEMILARARITSFLDFGQACLSNPGGNALSAAGISVEGGLICRDRNPSTFVGRVVLDHARILPDLDLTGARLAETADPLSCAFLVAEQLRLPLSRVSGTVDLSHAQLGILDAKPQSTPAGIRANELTYEALIPPLPARERIEWLNRQTGYLPQPYEQLAASYRRIGDDAGARSVLLARERRRHQNSSAPVKLSGLLQDVTMGYGYRPARAALWLIALLALGTIIFGLHPPAPIRSGQALQFNPLFYALDLLIPVVTFGQQTAFAPKGGYQWLAYGLMAAGWLLAITVFASITRALSRN
jgi:hypothetical protein